MLKLSICFAAIAVPLQVVVGDLHGLKVRDHQPMKLAAIEGHWETMRGAPLLLFAWPDEAARDQSLRSERAEARQPHPHARHRRRGRGTEGSRAGARPPVAPVFFGFRIMVGIGILMLTLVAWSAWQWRRGRLFQSKAVFARGC